MVCHTQINEVVKLCLHESRKILFKTFGDEVLYTTHLVTLFCLL